jgi:hypothetical protein
LKGDEAEDGLHFPRRVRAVAGKNDSHDFAVVHVKTSFAFWIFALLYLCEKPLSGEVLTAKELEYFCGMVHDLFAISCSFMIYLLVGSVAGTWDVSPAFSKRATKNHQQKAGE